MKKEHAILLVLVLAIGGIMFWKQLLAIFARMTALDAMEFIVTFLLKVVVLAIVSWLAYNLPKLINPWVRALRQKRRQAKRGRHQQAEGGSPLQIKSPKVDASKILTALLLKQLPPPKGPQLTGSNDDDPANRIRLDDF